MVLLTGATGTTGGEIAQLLTEKKVDFQLGARNVAKAEAQFPGQTIVPLSWDDPSTFAPALAGVDTVFLLGIAFSVDFDQKARPFLDAAQAAGVRHIVYLSALGVDSSQDNVHGRMEKWLENSGLEYTFLRPSFFSQNFLKYDLPFLQQGQIYLPTGEGKAAYVDARDIAEIAATVLADPAAHRRQTYLITGPEAISHGEAARIFSAELERPVAFVDPSPEAYAETLAGFGLPATSVAFAGELYGYIRNGWMAGVTETVPQLLGRPARSFQQFVADHKAAFNN